jgi:hypothetical protein
LNVKKQSLPGEYVDLVKREETRHLLLLELEKIEAANLLHEFMAKYD